MTAGIRITMPRVRLQIFGLVLFRVDHICHMLCCQAAFDVYVRADRSLSKENSVLHPADWLLASYVSPHFCC